MGIKKNEALEYRLKGDDWLEKGAIKKALAAYSRAVAKDPGSVWNLQSLAVAAGLNGWQIVARNLYCRALAIDAGEVRRWYDEHRLQLKNPCLIDGPVFVIGAPHSGTTIMTRLIGAHPAIMHSELRETYLFMKSEDEIDDALQCWDHACVENEKKRWVEKSVIHTLMIPRLLMARPKAKFVFVMRDGRDVVASLKTRKYTYRDFNELLDQWLLMNKAAEEYLDQPNFTLIKYEDLIEDPQATLEKVCVAIGEKFDPEMLNFNKRQTAWNDVAADEKVGELTDHQAHYRLRTWQINQALFDGRNRWQADLTETEKELFKKRAQGDLEKYEYVIDDQW